MNLSILGVAAALAVAPIAANAVTIEGSFSDVVTNLLVVGSSGDGEVTSVSGNGSTTSWTFEMGETGFVSGLGTVRRFSRFHDLEVLFNGVAVSFMAGAGDTASFVFDKTAFAVGSVFDVVVSFSGAVKNANVDFDLEVTAIPLPAAGWMLLAGVAGLGYVARRKVAAA